MVIIMIITNDKRLLSIYVHSAFDKRYIFHHCWHGPRDHWGFAPVIQGGDLPSDLGGIACIRIGHYGTIQMLYYYY